MGQHPLILGYKQTYDRKFPLILVVGREPNNNSISNGNIGLFDFVEYWRCAFWNVSFSVLGRINGITCKEIKKEFVNRKSSPLLFVDAFALGIRNEDKDKHSTRIAQSALAGKQIEAIFKHVEILKRVKLVILSGLSNPVYFGKFKNEITEKFELMNIPVLNVPFFYPTNMPKIFDTLTDYDKLLLKNIYVSYLQETDGLPELANEVLNKYEIDAPMTKEGII